MTQEALKLAVYGYCPECGAKGVTRERRPNGNDKCAKGHTYPSNTALPQRTWVGLTNEEIDSCFEDHGWSPSESYYPVIKAIEDKLKQKNHVAQETNS